MSLQAILNVSCADVGANKPAQVCVCVCVLFLTEVACVDLSLVFLSCVLPPSSSSVLSSTNTHPGRESYLLFATWLPYFGTYLNKTFCSCLLVPATAMDNRSVSEM